MASCTDAIGRRRLDNWARFGGTLSNPADAQLQQTTWRLPCMGWQGTPDINLSPCFYPEITRAYQKAGTDGLPSPRPVVRIRAHVINGTGLIDATGTTLPDKPQAEPKPVVPTKSWCPSPGSWESSFNNCVCPTGGGCADSSGGSGCQGDSTSGMWFGESCGTCSCTAATIGGGSDGGASTTKLTEATFRQAVNQINKRTIFDFVDLDAQAAVFNIKRPTQAEWSRLSGEGIASGNMTHIRWLYDLFGVPHGAAPAGSTTGPDNISPFIEFFLVPKIDTNGMAFKRGTSMLSPMVLAREGDLASLSGCIDTLAHELGHIWGLRHTFDGLLLADLKKSKGVKTPGSCSECVPVEANGEVAGDCISDTPPTSSANVNTDYYPGAVAGSIDYQKCTLSFDSSAFCTVLPGGPGNHGNMRNIMSYDDAGCRHTVTPVQQARMRCFMDQDFGQVHVPNLPPGLVVLHAKEVGGNKVSLSWLPPVSDVWCTKSGGCTTKYLVERRSTAAGNATSSTSWERLAEVVGTTRTYADNVPAAGCFEYRIRAGDASGKIGRGTAPVRLRVGEATTPALLANSCTSLNYTTSGGNYTGSRGGP